jgi:hypothetical protein
VAYDFINGRVHSQLERNVRVVGAVDAEDVCSAATNRKTHKRMILMDTKWTSIHNS